MKCVILQPSYIPWRGYFHQIQKADLFVFYDDVQYDKHGWRNRNKIKTAAGSRWLTVPVASKGVVENRTPINQIKISSAEDWAKKHLASIKQAYSKAPFFDKYQALIESIYRNVPELLADFTIDSTILLARELGIEKTRFVRSSSLRVEGQKTDRLIAILETIGATHYISGPSARAYIEVEKFAAANINLEYMTYDYAEYPQLYPPFDTQVSVLDLLLMTGERAPELIWR